MKITTLIGNVVMTAALLGTAATPALAVDLTGTWDGKAVCKGFFGGQIANDTFTGPVTITQTGRDLNMEFFGVVYNGGFDDDLKAPDKKGQGSFVACSTQAEPLADYNETGHLKATISPAKSSFTATSVYTTASSGSLATVQTCKWTFKRVDTNDPAVSACP